MGNSCGCIPIHSNEIQKQIKNNNEFLRGIDSLNYDFRLHSKLAWAYLNDLRTQPKKYSKMIEDSMILEVDPEEEQKHISSYNPEIQSHIVKSYISNYIKSHEDSKSIIKEISVKLTSLKDHNIKPLEWSDELYNAIEGCYKEISNRKIESVKESLDHQMQEEESIFDSVSFSVLFSKATNKNLKVVDYTIEGFLKPEICIWNLLLRNKEKINDFLSDEYLNFVIFAYCEEEGNFKSLKTKALFIYEVQMKNIVINGVNPITGNYQPFSLYESILKDITYKNDIIGGSYVYIGDTVNFVFYLSNGDKKEENIQVDKDMIL